MPVDERTPPADGIKAEPVPAPQTIVSPGPAWALEKNLCVTDTLMVFGGVALPPPHAAAARQTAAATVVSCLISE